ncbi:MAG: hypothetical protein AAGA73_14765 [Pseudomonadota bacterium]
MKSMVAGLALTVMSCVSAAGVKADEPSIERVFKGATKDDVWQAVVSSLEANDIPVVASDFDRGKIRARQHDYLDGRWAACPDLDATNFDPLSPANLRSRTWPLYRGVDLRLEITGTETGTQLALDPRYYDVGRDFGRREFAVQVRCQSTGVLEQALFNAAGES